MTNIVTNWSPPCPALICEAKAHLSELVSKAENGEETIIMRRGEAVAKLVPFAIPKKALRTRAAFRAALRKAGYAVDVSGDGEDAWHVRIQMLYCDRSRHHVFQACHFLGYDPAGGFPSPPTAYRRGRRAQNLSRSRTSRAREGLTLYGTLNVKH